VVEKVGVRGSVGTSAGASALKTFKLRGKLAIYNFLGGRTSALGARSDLVSEAPVWRRSPQFHLLPGSLASTLMPYHPISTRSLTLILSRQRNSLQSVHVLVPAKSLAPLARTKVGTFCLQDIQYSSTIASPRHDASQPTRHPASPMEWICELFQLDRGCCDLEGGLWEAHDSVDRILHERYRQSGMPDSHWGPSAARL
jgi:hypothetical protein